MASATPPDRPQTDSRTSARLVATGILLSRIAGLIREVVFARYLGTSLPASAFRAALRLPNILQNLLGEGTLSASFIPVYSDLLERGEKRAAGRLAGAVFALLLAVAGAFAVIGVTLAPVFVRIFFWGFSGELREVTIRCVRIIFPMTGLLVVSAWALGILNSHRRFFVSYAAPIVWNVAIIATLVAFGGRLAGSDLVVAVSWGALLGGLLQFLVQLPWVLRLERSLRVGMDITSPAVRKVLDNAGPAVLGRGVVQLSAYLDLWLASFLFEGAVASLGFAQALYVLPISLFGMAVAAAELPEMSRQAAAHSEALRARVEAGVRRMAVLVVPSFVGYVVLGDIIVAALYQRGRFLPVDTLLVWIILAAYSFGLLASTTTRLYSSAFYALGDTRSPAKIAAIRVTIAAALGAVLMLFAERFAMVAPASIVVNAGDAEGLRPLGAAGLASAAAVAAWVEWTLLRKRLRSRIGPTGTRQGAILRLGLSALVPALLIRLAVPVMPPLHPVALAAIVLPAFGAAYFVLASAAGVVEAREVVGHALRRLMARGRGA